MVSILVLMELPLQPFPKKEGPGFGATVSILVLMELPLQHLSKTSDILAELLFQSLF